MKIVNCLEIETEPNDSEEYPIIVKRVFGHILIELEYMDMRNRGWFELSPERNLHSLMVKALDVDIGGVVITGWQFCKEKHPDYYQIMSQDKWYVIPVKWDATEFDSSLFLL